MTAHGHYRLRSPTVTCGHEGGGLTPADSGSQPLVRPGSGAVVTLPLTLAALVAGVLSVATAAAVSRRRGAVGWASVAAAMGVAAALGLLALVWTGTLPSGQIRWGFTAMHLLYLGLTITLPMLGAGLVVLGMRSGRAALPLAVGGLLLRVGRWAA